jgi:hypothetical protein
MEREEILQILQRDFHAAKQRLDAATGLDKWILSRRAQHARDREKTLSLGSRVVHLTKVLSSVARQGWARSAYCFRG